MPKKTKEEVIELPQGNGQPSPKLISEITTDFGRGDLNEMRDKLNEVIKHLNA